MHELIDSEKGMSNYDKLSLQLKTVQRELELAISKKQQKIIFIHGRGEGVLKKELRILCSKYPVELPRCLLYRIWHGCNGSHYFSK